MRDQAHDWFIGRRQADGRMVEMQDIPPEIVDDILNQLLDGDSVTDGLLACMHAGAVHGAARINAMICDHIRTWRQRGEM